MSKLIYLEDMMLNEETVVGTHRFEQEAMIAFAEKYDPQTQHVDPIAAKETYVGELVASYWYVCAIWMKLMISNRMETAQKDPSAPRPAGHGSPGFLDMKWLEPVRPGDVVTYRSVSTEKIELKSRQDIGIIRSRNEAWIDSGKLALTFTGQGLIGRKPQS